MPNQLPSAWTLIKDSWSSFIKNWNDTFKISVWYIYIGLANVAMLLVLKTIDLDQNNILHVILSVTLIAADIWVGIRVLQAVIEI